MQQRCTYKGQILPAMQLIGVGHCPSVPASEIKIGDRLVWNYGSGSTVKDIKQTSKQFLTIIEESEHDGKDYPRKLKITRHVVAQRDGEYVAALNI